MINAIFAQPTYVASKQMLDATAARHQAIAANLELGNAGLPARGSGTVISKPASERHQQR